MEKRTRRQLCFILSVLMMLMMFLSGMIVASADSQSNGTAGAPIANAASVNDISKHWAKEQISDWVSKGFVKGYSDNTFKPDKTITRAEFITLVNSVFGFVEKAPISFKDVKASDWYNEEIAKAIEIGYVKGYTDGTMKPNAQISRQEVAAVIANILRLQAAENSPEIQKLKDIKDTKTWAKGAIGAVLEQGYMKGYTDQTFKIANPITRAEATVALSNVAGVIYNKEGTYGNDTVTTMDGNVSVNKSGVNLKNLSIKGNLYLTEGIGNGNVILENVTVSGKTLICGGGMESIIIKNSMLGATLVDKKDGRVRLEANGSTQIGKVELRSGSKLEEKDLTGTGFGSVEIKEVKDSASTIQLVGNFADVNVGSAAQFELVKGSVGTLQAIEGSKNAGITVLSGTVASLNIMAVVNVDIKAGTITNVVVASVAAGATIAVQAGAIITSLKTDAAIAVSGTGKIESAQVNVVGVKFEVAPIKLDTAPSVVVQIGDVKTTPAPTAKATVTASTGSSGGSGGGSSSGGSTERVLVSSIRVETQGSVSSVVYGETLKMNAIVLPSYADNKSVTWSVYSGPATISLDGLLTPTSAGLVKVMATAKDGSGVKGSKDISVYAGLIGTPIEIGAQDPSVVISVYGDTFAYEAIELDNWLIDVDETGLEVSGITLQGKAGEATSVIISFTGTAGAGTIIIQATKGALTSGMVTEELSSKISLIKVTGVKLKSVTNAEILYDLRESNNKPSLDAAGQMIVFIDDVLPVTIKDIAFYKYVSWGKTKLDLDKVSLKGFIPERVTEFAPAFENNENYWFYMPTGKGDFYFLVLFLDKDKNIIGFYQNDSPFTIEDKIAPVLSATSASDVTEISAKLNFTSDDAGTYYYLVLEASEEAPNAATIKAQGTSVDKGTAAAIAGINTTNVTGLAAKTAYKAYVVVEDATGNISEVLTIEFTTADAIPVSAISVTGTGGVTTITTDNGTLQMIADVQPTNASNKSVTWSVTNEDDSATDKATISNSGVLTAVKNGTVKVKATSVSTPSVSGIKVITISGQVVPADITAASVTITAPVLGVAPQDAGAVESATSNADYTVTGLVWNEDLTTGGKFKAAQVYTATVTLTSKNGKKFQAAAFTPTVAGSASVGTTTTTGDVVGNTVSFTVNYAETGALEVDSIAVTTQPTKMSYTETTDGTLALNGMVVTETNNDGSTNVVTFTDGTATGYTADPANGAALTQASHDGQPVVITHTESGKTANTGNLTVGE